MIFRFSEQELHDMTDNTVEIMSTSTNTADASPIILKQTELIRFKFHPVLVNNSIEPTKSVSGKIVYEKKKKKDASFPSESIDNSTDEKVTKQTVKVGDRLELSFDTSETYELFSGLRELYDLFNSNIENGIPYGHSSYRKVDSRDKQILSLLRDNPDVAKLICAPENKDLIKLLFQQITCQESLDSLRNSLALLQDENLGVLTSSLNLEKLQRASDLIRSNYDNGNEEFWQKRVFKDNQWILGQVFACPYTIFDEKAYVGGKDIGNKSGNVCDFIYKNRITNNIALIEIKTPKATLLGSEYRGTYSMSRELSGAINQILNYKDNLSKEYYTLQAKSNEQFNVFTPKCVIVIGLISEVNKDSEKIAAFENYRNSLSNITIVTFDELDQRIRDLISIISDDTTVTF